MSNHESEKVQSTQETGNREHGELLKIGKESAIALIGAFSGVTLNYIFLMLITRILSPKEYGTYVLAQSIVTSLSVFVLVGAPDLLDRFIPFFQASGQQGKVKTLVLGVIKLTLVLGFIFVIAMYFFAPHLSTAFFANPDLTTVLRIMSLSLPLIAFTQVVSFVFIGLKELRYQAITEYFSLPILLIIFITGLWFFQGNLIHWIWLYVASCLGSALLSLWFLIRKATPFFFSVPKLSISRSEMIRFAWPLSLNTLLIILLNQIDVLVLGAYRSPQEVAIYRIYFFIALVPNFVHVSLGKICKPFASGYVATMRFLEVEEIFRRTSRWSLSLNAFFIGLFIVFGRDLIAWLFTPGYDVYFSALIVLLIGRYLNSYCGYPSRTLEAFGNVRLILLNISILFLSNILLDLVLVPRYGVYGAAFASSFCLFLWNILSILEIKYIHHLNLFDRKNMYTFVGFTGVFILAIVFRQTLTLLGPWLRDILVISLFLFGYVIILQKSTDSGDREVIKRIVSFLFGLRKKFF